MFTILKLTKTFILTFFEEYIRIGILNKCFKEFSFKIKRIKYIYFSNEHSLVANIVEFIWYNIRKRYIRLKVILFRDQTTSVRFFFGLMCIGLSSFFLFGTTLSLQQESSEYRLMLGILPKWIWAISYFIIGVSLIYGVIEEKFNFFLLITEGLLNVITWGVSTYYIYQAQGVLGAHFIGFIMATWLYIRYPTHKMKSDSYYRRRIVENIPPSFKNTEGGK